MVKQKYLQNKIIYIGMNRPWNEHLKGALSNRFISLHYTLYTYFCVSYIIVISERIRQLPFN